ncbi:MAG TPA: SGNH/GDSL hydrolase family protein [Hyphomonadaceae bacterium]|nr:SGNH/GDSL hydrolase family protein [Hyphomonadaceae bacterium]
MIARRLVLAITAVALSACQLAPSAKPALPPGARYVAMGSSYAAGPGIEPYADASPGPCFRSTLNYAHQLAQRKGLALTDAGCSGATTYHLDGPRGAIPPQLDAVDAQTRLVTITIGGNDVNFVGRLGAGSCIGLAEQTGDPSASCARIPPVPTEQDYATLAARMDKIAKDVRRRAPLARLIFIDYPLVLPASGLCPAIPLSQTEADIDREIARRLAAITAKAAADNGADLVRASKISEGHDACAANAWMNGYPRPGAPVAGTNYHPNAKGMTAIADALENLLRN